MNSLPARPEEARWAAMPFMEQMANIGSEVGRTAKWATKGKVNLAESAYIRALDLFDLTIKYGRLNSPGRSAALTELCRSRDLFAQAVQDSDIDTLNWLDNYFLHFAAAER